MNLIREYIRTVLNEGVFEAPSAMVDAVYNWATSEMQKYREHVRSGESFQHLDAKTKIPIDLTGWKYGDVLEDYMEKAAVSHDEMMDHVRMHRERNRKKGNEDGVRAAEEMLDLFEKQREDIINKRRAITVTLQLGSGHQAATWQAAADTMAIFFRAGQTDKELRNTIEHELRHFGQNLLADAKGTSHAGYPSKKIMSRMGHAGGTDVGEHDIADVEFYPVLADEIRRAQEEDADVRSFIADSSFFQILKQRAPGKFRKAVAELTKAIG